MSTTNRPRVLPHVDSWRDYLAPVDLRVFVALSTRALLLLVAFAALLGLGGLIGGSATTLVGVGFAGTAVVLTWVLVMATARLYRTG